MSTSFLEELMFAGNGSTTAHHIAVTAGCVQQQDSKLCAGAVQG